MFDELEKIAKEATPGPWGKENNDRFLVGSDVTHCEVAKAAGASKENTKANQEFIATFNPTLILKLLDVVKAGESMEHASWCDNRFLDKNECNCDQSDIFYSIKALEEK